MALRMTFSTARRSSSGSPSTTARPRACRTADRSRARWLRSCESSTSSCTSSSRRTGLWRSELGIAFGPRHLQQLAYQRIQPVGFLLDPVERLIQVVAGPCQLDGHAQPSQRRTQFVRNVEQQAALRREQGFGAAGHAVEGAGQLAEFVLPCRSPRGPRGRRGRTVPPPFAGSAPGW